MDARFIFQEQRTRGDVLIREFDDGNAEGHVFLAHRFMVSGGNAYILSDGLFFPFDNDAPDFGAATKPLKKAVTPLTFDIDAPDSAERAIVEAERIMLGAYGGSPVYVTADDVGDIAYTEYPPAGFLRTDIGFNLRQNVRGALALEYARLSG